VARELRERADVVWPPHAQKVRTSRLDPTPGPEDFKDAKLWKVCPLIPGRSSIDLWVVHRDKYEVLLAVDVLDAHLRGPVAHLLEKHRGKTIMELGNLEVDF